MNEHVTIIGGGLAGVEAAYQIARRGGKVVLYEMKPKRFSPVHKLSSLAELVCSNSFKSVELNNAHGLLKEEMRILGSLIIEAAEATRVEAGKALAVDRERFSEYVTERIKSFPRIEIIREEICVIPEARPLIIATGPLTSPSLSDALRELTGEGHLYFYDAIAPIVYRDSINFEKTFFASRYGAGNDYINCPFTKDEYEHFIDALLSAEKVPFKDFEKEFYFEACLPVEVIAERNRYAPAYGPMKPTGLIDPRTGKRPFAVVQLRKEVKDGTLYSMVGFQTKLTYSEQNRIFRLIPGLENAEFARFGSVHRNTYINSPELLKKTLQFKKDEGIFFAGQITGIDGYAESSSTGIIAGINASRYSMGKKCVVPSDMTMIGALLSYITEENRVDFQPINSNFGLLQKMGEKKLNRQQLVRRALIEIRDFVEIIRE